MDTLGVDILVKVSFLSHKNYRKYAKNRDFKKSFCDFLTIFGSKRGFLFIFSPSKVGGAFSFMRLGYFLLPQRKRPTTMMAKSCLAPFIVSSISGKIRYFVSFFIFFLAEAMVYSSKIDICSCCCCSSSS